MAEFPEKMKQYNNWVCHKKKVPKNPKNGHNCVGKYDTWGTTYEMAVKAKEKYGFDGIGFVFKKSDPFCGIDLDGCIINGKLSDQASRILDFCKSYSEVSVSGTGMHVIVESNGNGEFVKKEKGIEIYTNNRFFALTGASSLNALPSVDQQYSLSPQNPKEVYEVWSRPPSLVGELFDEKLPIGKIALLVKRMKSNPKFKRLWAGDMQGYNSNSEADLALCSIISHYVNGNKTHIDQIFRNSKLFRPKKWDRSAGGGKTYADVTIEKALEVEEDEAPLEEETGKKMRPMVFDEFMTTPRPEIKTILSPWLTMGSTHMIYGPRGAGKTFFALSLALAITRDSDFGSWEIKEPVNCLYCDGEMMPQDMVKRMRNLLCNVGDKVKDLYILSSGQLQYDGMPSVNVSKNKHQKDIYEMVLEHNIQVLILDNIAALTPGVEENNSTEWDNIAAWANIMKRTGCSVIFVHHSGKAGTQRGTSGREDMLESVLKLKPVTGNAEDGLNVDVIFEKSRHIAGEQARSIGFNLTSEPGESDLVWGFSGAGNAKREKVIGMLVKGYTQRQIKDELRISSRTITKYKKFAMGKGWIKEDTGKIKYTIEGSQILEKDYEF